MRPWKWARARYRRREHVAAGAALAVHDDADAGEHAVDRHQQADGADGHEAHVVDAADGARDLGQGRGDDDAEQAKRIAGAQADTSAAFGAGGGSGLRPLEKSRPTASSTALTRLATESTRVLTRFSNSGPFPAIAVICGTPAPLTTRVVQMDPGPMPTLIPSAPNLMRSRAPSYDATLPARS